MTLFDAYLMVDWSAANRPKTGKDSIWFALVDWVGSELRISKLDNPETRWSARVQLGDLLADLLASDKRVLVGFDFPFGYPRGTANALGLVGMPWRAAWMLLARQINDNQNNLNNRFHVADLLNKTICHPEGPFWGHPHKQSYRHLKPKKPAYDYGLAEKRICESLLSGPQPVWKLNGAGSVGGQTLTGLPVVNALRNDARLQSYSCIWPFETGLKILEVKELKHHPIVFAEIYPSLVPIESPSKQVKDALQVQAIAVHIAEMDKNQRLGMLFAGASSLNQSERDSVEQEEAWILGVCDNV
ncbi:MAG: cobalamin biosynthesis protein CbiG [Gammaproteobacteria bacterium]|nr:cobalamin biosynthesis protein CbiG [Gammaproteobacteria bacterium]MDE0511378.1 cobalamin biosynthesis protein CbiG [Gammaproteobacteria bacterium]